MAHNAQEPGFTLTELVVVITILGVLAAFAVPRFASLEMQARTAARDALAGSVRSSAALAHALWLAEGRPATITMEGRSITMVNGYPDRATIDDSLSDYRSYTYSAGDGRFTRAEGPGCWVQYTQAPANGAPAVLTGGTC